MYYCIVMDYYKQNFELQENENMFSKLGILNHKLLYTERTDIFGIEKWKRKYRGKMTTWNIVYIMNNP